jgi:hypothetical protein
MKTFKEFGEYFKAHPTEKLSTTSFAAAVRPAYSDTQESPPMLALTDKEKEKQKEKKKRKDRILKKSRRYLPDEPKK